MVLNYKEDELNIKGKRNLRNTDKSTYNCGGYALGVFGWYGPYPEEEKPNYWGFFGHAQMEIPKLLEKTVQNLLQEFPDLRLINDLSELGKDEYAIAYRVGERDYHFMKRIGNRWFQKRGGLHKIERVSEKEVFSESWADGFYSSELKLFAKKMK